jgi:effector-binding domain-containing protein
VFFKIEKGELMTYPCELKDLPNQPVLSIRIHTDVLNLPQALGEAYGAIAAYLAELGDTSAGAAFAAYYNMDMQDLDMAAGFTVSKSLPAREPVESTEIPAGQYATCLYTGPYNEIGKGYDELMDWIKEHHLEPTGLAYEFYLDDPAQTHPDILRTEIRFPVMLGE